MKTDYDFSVLLVVQLGLVFSLETPSTPISGCPAFCFSNFCQIRLDEIRIALQQIRNL